jgi:hypothetical protein
MTDEQTVHDAMAHGYAVAAFMAIQRMFNANISREAARRLIVADFPEYTDSQFSKSWDEVRKECVMRLCEEWFDYGCSESADGSVVVTISGFPPMTFTGAEFMRRYGYLAR